MLGPGLGRMGCMCPVAGGMLVADNRQYSLPVGSLDHMSGKKMGIRLVGMPAAGSLAAGSLAVGTAVAAGMQGPVVGMDFHTGSAARCTPFILMPIQIGDQGAFQKARSDDNFLSSGQKFPSEKVGH